MDEKMWYGMAEAGGTEIARCQSPKLDYVHEFLDAAVDGLPDGTEWRKWVSRDPTAIPHSVGRKHS